MKMVMTGLHGKELSKEDLRELLHEWQLSMNRLEQTDPTPENREDCHRLTEELRAIRWRKTRNDFDEPNWIE